MKDRRRELRLTTKDEPGRCVFAGMDRLEDCVHHRARIPRDGLQLKRNQESPATLRHSPSGSRPPMKEGHLPTGRQSDGYVIRGRGLRREQR
jgi:hypothetical protein